MKKRYERNVMTLTPEESDRLADFSVCVAGCGGLGGYVLEYLGRLGVGRLTAVDGDVFDESNLNRQILSDEEAIGKSKAETARARMAKVNSDVRVTPVHAFITEENCEEIIKGHDLVMDALDNIHTRRLLERACQKQGIPLIHGAIAGWYGQVAVSMPDHPVFDLLYPEQSEKDVDRGVEIELGNPSFTPGMIAAVQSAEACKVLLGREGTLAGRLLTIDLLNHAYEVFEMS